MDPLIAGLTETQVAAVMSRHARILSVAVAGSGKTRVLTRRIVRLIREGVPPDKILAVTFTRDAAEVMRERVEALLVEHGIRSDPPEIMTFHAWGYKLIRAFAKELGYHTEVTVYDQTDLQAVANSEAGRNLRGLEARMASDDTFRRTIEARVGQAGAVTFNMIERTTLDLLAGAVPGVDLRSSQWGRFEHVLVDEYQDVNIAQALVVETLAPNNLFVTGDPSQSIYGFRGAQPARLRSLLGSLGWEVYELSQTFRHGRSIVELANAVRPDHLVTRSERDDGDVRVVRGPTPDACCASAVQALVAEGVAPQDIAILGRTWREVTAVQRAVEAHAPTFLAAPDDDPWNRPGPRLVSVGLRLARNPYDNELALRLAAVLLPEVNLRDAAWEALMARQALSIYLRRHPAWAALPLASRDALTIARALVGPITQALSLDVSIGWCADFITERGMTLDTYHSWWAERGMAIRWRRQRSGDAVYLGTVHASKGQEWPAVIIPDARDGVYPPRRRSRQSLREHQQDVEEARRVLYVAVTRAQRVVVLARAQAAPAWGGELEWCSVSPWLVAP